MTEPAGGTFSRRRLLLGGGPRYGGGPPPPGTRDRETAAQLSE